jgi:outer membrane protein assembly factor BamB
MKISRLLPALLLFAPASVAALDWPQWRGPERNDLSKETGLLTSWPKDGPKLLWSCTDAGLGYSGPAVVGDRLYTMGAFKDRETLYALDVHTGKKLWSGEVGPFYECAWGGGPRATPTVDGELIYAMGAHGRLLCVKAATGDKVWLVDLKKDLGGVSKKYAAQWGYTESPLIDGDRVVVTPGGPRGTLAALNKKTGSVLWRSTEWTDEADYSSVVRHMINDVPMYVQMTGDSVAGVSPADGSLLWRFARPAKITISTPVCFANYVYVSSSYSVGCDLIELTPEGKKFRARGVYDDATRKAMQNHHGGVILLDGRIYGYSDPLKGWTCQDATTGKVAWASRALGKGSLTYADGHFYCFSEDRGTCVLIDAIPKAWTEKGRFDIRQSKLPRPPRNSTNVWTHPVVADGRLYLRDQDQLFCYDVKQR